MYTYNDPTVFRVFFEKMLVLALSPFMVMVVSFTVWSVIFLYREWKIVRKLKRARANATTSNLSIISAFRKKLSDDVSPTSSNEGGSTSKTNSALSKMKKASGFLEHAEEVKQNPLKQSF